METVSRIRPLLVGLLVAGATVGGLSGRTGPARADTDTGSTTANVQVNLAITLSDLSPSFTLTGAPGATVTTPSPVTMRVTTNSFTGYAVTVQPAAPALTGDTAGNTDTIPMTLLEVSGPAQAGAFTPLSTTSPVEVVRKTSASAPDGDVINHDYRITIPAVRPDIYRETINYIATTL